MFFKDTATTEIYTYDTLFPYTTLFRSEAAHRNGDSTGPRSMARRGTPCRRLRMATTPFRSRYETSFGQPVARIPQQAQIEGVDDRQQECQYAKRVQYGPGMDIGHAGELDHLYQRSAPKHTTPAPRTTRPHPPQ